MAVLDTLTSDNIVLRCFITHSAVLLLKMLFVVFLTVFWRVKSKAVENPEDARGGREVKKDADVERVRRVHMNDIENIFPFIIFGYFYVLTNPNIYVALNLIRVFTGARICHTIFYGIYPVAPLRSLSFFVGLLILIYIIIYTTCCFFQI